MSIKEQDIFRRNVEYRKKERAAQEADKALDIYEMESCIRL